MLTKLTITFLFMVITTTGLLAQREFSLTEGDTTYVMKRYVFMHLLSGSEKNLDSLQALSIQKQHLDHLNMLSDSGKLVMAGPFQNGGNYRGLLIFDVETIEEAPPPVRFCQTGLALEKERFGKVGNGGCGSGVSMNRMIHLSGSR